MLDLENSPVTTEAFHSTKNEIHIPIPKCNRCGRHWNFKDHIERAIKIAQLTPKETEVFTLMLKGFTMQEIAEILNNTRKTIKHHQHQIHVKFDVTTRPELFHKLFPV